MAGLLVQLLLSWILLWAFEKKNLLVLGIAPTTRRFLLFCGGFLLSAVVCATYNLLTTAFANNGWTMNQQLNAGAALNGIWWVLRSVLFEELIFRGALLYLAIRRLGATRACFLSAACFGVYHWFSYNAFANPLAMVFIFLLTAVAGLLFAFAFAKTGSIYVPIALHFGWNLVHAVVFSNGPLGRQLFVRINENQAQGILSLLIFLFQLLALPLLGYLFIKRFAGSEPLAAAKVHQPVTQAL